MVINLVDIDRVVREQVLDRFDHQNLNFTPEFREQVPTTENLCVAIYNILKQTLAGTHLDKVRLEETSKNSFEVLGE